MTILVARLDALAINPHATITGGTRPTRVNSADRAIFQITEPTKTMINYNCDHNWSAHCSSNPEVRVLRTTSDKYGSNVICCQVHYRTEMMFRTELNKELAPECQYPFPAWDSLEVYSHD